jgi:hypothetical protein
VTRRGIQQNVGRLHILMNQVSFVQSADCSGKTDRAITSGLLLVISVGVDLMIMRA